MATFVDLPNEMLDKIAQYMDVRSVYNLRQTNKHFAPSCDQYLQKHLTVLYLHPTSNSMKYLLQICESDVHAGGIAELCLLGDPVWDIIMKEFPTYRTDRFEEGLLTTSAPMEWWQL